jgi:hypothetical protein
MFEIKKVNHNHDIVGVPSETLYGTGEKSTPSPNLTKHYVELRDEITGKIGSIIVPASCEDSAVAKVFAALHCRNNSDHVLGAGITSRGVGLNITATQLAETSDLN